ncbi:DNA-3-methyladenine glycosylase II [Frigoriglobus tundricola]|uniref:DNA-3-methyladenine glycosylase II n=2 Tax=Frigoriglobus tundricola TaxID=2774151 RepID=A0A6M5YQP3_9BACT|nr:DNA-3-methyladenine glycosylase II [Frigoriglobus tundricola]
MKRLIERVGPCTLAPKPFDPFTLLVRCVISQQISTKAADSIFNRLAAAIAGPAEPHPVSADTTAAWQRTVSIPLATLATFTEAEYKACGVSGPKQRALRSVIDHVETHPDLLPNIPTLADEVLREQLVAIKGIGPWTVDMFLLFGIARPDVWAVGDYGLKVAVKTHFNLRKLPDAKKMTKLAKPWEPYRSVASWYLWRSLEPQYRDEKT